MRDEARRSGRKFWPTSKVYLAGIVTLILLVSVGIWSMVDSTANRGTIPQNIRDAVDFSLYYPKELPAGFKVDPASFSIGSNVVAYTISYNPDSKLAVSLEPVPPSFDFEMFYEKSLRNTQTLVSRIGKTTIGRLNGVETASIMTTDKTWILITAPNGIDDNALRSVIQSLRAVPADQ